MSELFYTVFLFFIVLDPLGNVPIFMSYLKEFDPPKQRAVILREMIFALVIMLLFLVLGHPFLKLLGIADSSLETAGGLILFLIAIKMVFANVSTTKEVVKKEPFLVPLAVPCVAGPSILATITLYSSVEGQKPFVFLSTIIAWALCVPVLFLAPTLKKTLKENGLIAVERLFGYLLVIIAIQMTLSGIEHALAS